MRQPRTGNTDIVHPVCRVPDGKRESPHHAPVAPAPAFFLCTSRAARCGRLPRATRSKNADEVGPYHSGRSRYPVQKPHNKVGSVKSLTGKERFRDCKGLERVVRELAGLTGMAPSGLHICQPRPRLGRSF